MIFCRVDGARRRVLFVIAIVGVRSLASPLAEPSAAAFFGFPDDGSIVAVERLRDVGPADFDKRIRHGRPFIVEDAGAGNAWLGASCQHFHEQFPGAQMRAEYTGGPREKFISLAGEAWFSKDRLTQPQKEHLSGGATQLNAPYVWHVKDGGHEAPPEIRAAMQREWVPPYFVRGATNMREANESMEFWFSRRNGAVLAHADTYCIPAVSLQLSGKKRWRLMPPPPISSTLDRYECHDGGLYNTGLWRPTYEATLHEGEAIVFLPNWFHETFIPEDNPECTVATTFQIQHPVPTRYIRAFLPTHVMSHLYYEGHCKDLWHSYATFRPPGTVQPSLDEAAIASSAESLLHRADADGDRRLTIEEIEGFLATGEPRSPDWASWFMTEDYFYDFRPAAEDRVVMSAEVLRNRAEDTLAYHDTDGDDVISAAELFGALRQWNVVHKKLHDFEKLGRKKKAMLRLEQQYAERYPGGGRSGAEMHEQVRTSADSEL